MFTSINMQYDAMNLFTWKIFVKFIDSRRNFHGGKKYKAKFCITFDMSQRSIHKNIR